MIRKGETYKLSVIKAGFGESIALSFFMFSKAKWNCSPLQEITQSSVKNLVSYYAFIHLFQHKISEQLSFLLEKNGKSQSKLAGEENINGNAYILHSA